MTEKDSVSNLPKLMDEVFKGVTICFCTLCSHQPEYGHCYACPCGNHQPTPVPATKEEIKLQHTVSHLIQLLHAIATECEQRSTRAIKKGGVGISLKMNADVWRILYAVGKWQESCECCCQACAELRNFYSDWQKRWRGIVDLPTCADSFVITGEPNDEHWPATEGG